MGRSKMRGHLSPISSRGKTNHPDFTLWCCSVDSMSNPASYVYTSLVSSNVHSTAELHHKHIPDR